MQVENISVVRMSLIRMLEYRIGFVDLYEALCGALIVAVAVGVVGFGEFEVRAVNRLACATSKLRGKLCIV